MTERFTRRAALQSFVAGAAGGTLGINAPAAADDPSKPVAAAAQPQGVCLLFPQAVEGPYYFDPALERPDITEGSAGAPLKLVLTFIESGSCAPLAGVRVDVWHADAGGVYSGYAGQGDGRDQSTKGKTYLRGTQRTNGEGRVAFKTIYPGWYPGRTPHIHIKAFLDKVTMLTGQVYFPDDVSQAVYRAHDPYKSRPVADTANVTDWIFQQGEKEGGGTVLAMTEEDGTAVASLLIAVDRSGGAARGAEGWGPRVRRWLGRE